MIARFLIQTLCRVGGMIILTISAVTRADVRLAPLFTDGLVMQRAQPLRIWGSADANESVKIEFAGNTVTAITAADGHWLATLPAQVTSTEGRDLQVTGKNVLRVRDILIGDVWLCSGQSNMEFTVQGALDGKREIATANQPLIRQIKIDHKLSDRPLDDFSASPWHPAQPAYVAGFTAVGYFFAREMVRETGVPVGIINCSWSGTSVEPWMSAKALAEKPEFSVVGERWQADLKAYPERRKVYEQALALWKHDEAQASAAGDNAHEIFLKEHHAPRLPAAAPDHPYPGNPSAIYNGMVYPLRHTAIRGVLWYQGEANAVRAKEYAALFQASIRGWRETFSQPELPFFWAQIANFAVDTDWPRLREAQGKALVLPVTGQAVTIDIGDPNDIHPKNKQEVGRRLSLIALAQLEHRAIEFSGPQFSHAEFTGGKARVSFIHATGLKSLNGPVSSLELAGADHIFFPADGTIDGELLTVTSTVVPKPVAVRYAWSASPRANLSNNAGLPASPFRSDDW